MLDRYLSGKVSRISPEAPVPVLEWGSEEDRLGGAANVALNVKALGATPYLCGVVGQDAEGFKLVELLSHAGLLNDGIVFSGERKTTVKTRVIAGSQHLLRIDRENTDELSQAEQSSFEKRVMQLMDSRQFQVLIFQDYDKGALNGENIAVFVREAKSRGILTVTDPKFRNFWAYSGVDLFKPNLKEVQDALHQKFNPEEKLLRKASQAIRNKLSNRHTLITLSEKGLFLDNENAWRLFPASPRNVEDVCGAGDTVVSIAALALALGLEMEEIAQLANFAGGQVVEKVGVAPVDREQLLTELLAFEEVSKE